MTGFAINLTLWTLYTLFLYLTLLTGNPVVALTGVALAIANAHRMQA